MQEVQQGEAKHAALEAEIAELSEQLSELRQVSMPAAHHEM